MIIIYEQIMGQWIDNNKTGRGIYTWPNGNRYEGQWIDDKKNGRGIYTCPDGARYERASSKIMFITFMILINTSDMANDHHL